MIIETTAKILFNTIIWSVFAEILAKVLPVPKKVLQVEDKAERNKKYFRHISCCVSIVYGTLMLLWATIVTLVYGVDIGSPTQSYHRGVLYVSSSIFLEYWLTLLVHQWIFRVWPYLRNYQEVQWCRHALPSRCVHPLPRLASILRLLRWRLCRDSDPSWNHQPPDQSHWNFAIYWKWISKFSPVASNGIFGRLYLGESILEYLDSKKGSSQPWCQPRL